jgi:iron(III) transport system substrate-binding protein
MVSGDRNQAGSETSIGGSRAGDADGSPAGAVIQPEEATLRGAMNFGGAMATASRIGTGWRAVAGLSLLTGLVIAASLSPAGAQGAPATKPWIDPALLAAAKAEGTVVVYSSTNEQEGLPLFKLFEDATGIKVQYVRASDSVLSSRMAIEFRANQASYDIVHITTISKLPQQMLAQVDLPEAKAISESARDPNRRWYGVYANYNTPAYNTQQIKASELPKTYEEFAKRKDWAGKVAIDGTDSEWLRALAIHYGEDKGLQIARDMADNLKPIVTDGHLALARSTGAGEYALSLNNYTNLTLNVKLGGAPIEFFALDPVAQFFGQVAVNARAPHPNAARLAANFMLSQESQAFLAKFGRLPTRADVQSNPPGALEEIQKKKVVPVLLSAEEDNRWRRAFDQIFKRR